LAECTLVDFGDEEIQEFVGKWTTALERAARGDTPVATLEAEREREELLGAVHRNPGVRGLAANPLLLTILALMKRQGVTLPERRVELYDQYVRTLLSSWNRARGLGRPPTRDLDVVETVRILAPLALWMHQVSPGVGLAKQGDLQRKLKEIYRERGEVDPERVARRFMEDVREYAGLLLERGAGRYGFIHLTFEEYLAAVGIARLGQRDIEPIVDILGKHVGDPAWREVALLTVGYLGVVQQWEEISSEVLKAFIEREPGEPGQALVLVGEAVVDAWPGGVTPGCKEKVVQALVGAVRREDVQPVLRAAAGRALAKLGDPRPGVGVLSPPPSAGEGPGVRALPDILWCYVLPGPFLMGDGREQHRNESITDGYLISRYPVTNAQFGAFVEAEGYQERRYWTEAGWEWKEREDWTAPRDYGEPFSLPNHPVVGVSWYEAVAFSRWLEERLQVSSFRFQVWREQQLETWDLKPETLTVRLPSEAEWEKAARGTEGRVFPWGGGADPDRANYADTGIGTTSAVGCFPGGASPYGVKDLSGNVWEWCATKWEDSYEDYRGDSDPEEEVRRVLRGGAFSLGARRVRCACRSRDYPYLRGVFIGFRVVASPVHL
jgi:formylglycine-generating enzyme required for sulfatase activity